MNILIKERESEMVTMDQINDKLSSASTEALEQKISAEYEFMINNLLNQFYEALSSDIDAGFYPWT